MQASVPFDFTSPLKINCGSHALSHLPLELSSRRLRAPLILASRERIGARRIQRVVDAFKASGLNLGLYECIPETHADGLLPALTRMYRDGGCDCIIAVGGDMVVNTAKHLNLMVSGVAATEGILTGDGRLHPLVLVPTPGGNGFEATGYAVDDRQRLWTTALMPAMAVIDPSMMDGEAKHEVVDGALIGLVHAVEAFLDERAGPFARTYAEAAIGMIFQNLPQALQGRQRRRRLTAVVNGQIAAGCAFTALKPGLCHRIAHNLNNDGDLPAGILMAMLLPHLIDIAGDISPPSVGGLLSPLAGPEICAQMAEDLKVPRIVAMLWEFLDTINRHLADPIPLTLADIGLTEAQIDTVARQNRTDADDPVARIIASAAKGMCILAG